MPATRRGRRVEPDVAAALGDAVTAGVRVLVAGAGPAAAVGLVARAGTWTETSSSRTLPGEVRPAPTRIATVPAGIRGVVHDIRPQVPRAGNRALCARSRQPLEPLTCTVRRGRSLPRYHAETTNRFPGRAGWAHEPLRVTTPGAATAPPSGTVRRTARRPVCVVVLEPIRAREDPDPRTCQQRVAAVPQSSKEAFLTTSRSPANALGAGVSATAAKRPSTARSRTTPRHRPARCWAVVIAGRPSSCGRIWTSSSHLAPVESRIRVWSGRLEGYARLETKTLPP